MAFSYFKQWAYPGRNPTPPAPAPNHENPPRLTDLEVRHRTFPQPPPSDQSSSDRFSSDRFSSDRFSTDFTEMDLDEETPTSGAIDLDAYFVPVQQQLAQHTERLEQLEWGMDRNFADLKEYVKECVTDVKECVTDVKGSVMDVKESVMDVKESVLDVKESVTDVKESVTGVKECVNQLSAEMEKDRKRGQRQRRAERRQRQRERKADRRQREKQEYQRQQERQEDRHHFGQSVQHVYHTVQGECGSYTTSYWSQSQAFNTSSSAAGHSTWAASPSANTAYGPSNYPRIPSGHRKRRDAGCNRAWETDARTLSRSPATGVTGPVATNISSAARAYSTPAAQTRHAPSPGLSSSALVLYNPGSHSETD